MSEAGLIVSRYNGRRSRERVVDDRAPNSRKAHSPDAPFSSIIGRLRPTKGTPENGAPLDGVLRTSQQGSIN